MKRIISNLLTCLVLLTCMIGCEEKKEDNSPQEVFMTGYTLDDGRHIAFTLDVPYKETRLGDALMNNDLTVDEFISKLEPVDTLKDGGSKIYKYNKVSSDFGLNDFYVINCNSLDGIKDIFIAKHKENLMNKCSYKYNDLEGVSMFIKEGTLTNKGVTVIITDTSNRDNIYGTPYSIDKYENGGFKKLDTIIDDYAWTMPGYYVGENNTLEFKVNWEKLYGKLEKGKYRIIKETSYAGEGTNHYITAEFVIKD